MPPLTRREPNRLDPLSESTPARRLWAASLAAGYTSRTSFADAIGIRHNTLSLFEAERTTLTLANFAIACELVGFTMQEIWFGRDRKRHREPALALEAIAALCEELDAPAPERHALKRFLDSPEGALQRVTASYIKAFIQAAREARENNEDREKATRAAIAAADNARATADALAAGVKPPSGRYRRTQNRAAKKRR